MLRLDLRDAIVVLVGTWNPAIFQPGWIARHLFDIPEGDEVQVTQVVTVERPPRVRHYIRNIGISATNQRVDITCNSPDPETLDTTEGIAMRLCEVLPHTPMGPFGINFKFIDDAPSNALLDRLAVADGIDAAFTINSTTISNQIQLDEDTLLNFSRKVADPGVQFSFNYHHPRATGQPVTGMLAGRIRRYLDTSRGILNQLYGLHQDGALTVRLRGNQEGNSE